jgi:serine/threonine protein kinase/tetratricopeptide (TPR) repeat protein
MAGQTYGGYRVVEEIGAGGMAQVYLAEKDGESVAVKVLHGHLLEEGVFLERFRREAEIGIRIQHQNVVRTLDYGVSDLLGQGDNFLVMEYVRGRTLRQLIDEMGRIPEKLCRHIAGEVASALVAIHAEGIIHRDLKPENVIITTDDVVKVMDLGIAFLSDEAIRLSLTGQFVGSIFYSAPEQIQGGGKDLDPRVDLYQLGVVLYEMACGEHPYRADDMRVALRRLLTEEPDRLADRNTQVTPFFDELVHTLLAKRRDRRFATAEALVRVLRTGESSEWWRHRQEQASTQVEPQLRRDRVPRETAHVGRSDELRLISELFGRAAAGEGQTLLVEADAGLGKSRLIDEAERRLGPGELSPQFLYGTFDPERSGSAPFAEAFFSFLGEEDLAEKLGAMLVENPRFVPAFAALLAGRTPPEGCAELTKESLQSVFAEATRSLSVDRPVVLTIEDLHVAGEDGLALFAALCVSLAADRVLLIGTARPGLATDWVAQLESREHFRKMALDRLGEADLRSLLEDALGSERLAESLYSRIAEKTDGKPFYVLELLRSLREGQFIGQRDDGTWVTTREIRSLRVPSTVLDLVSDRLEGLEDRDRAILGVAACIGFEFEPGLIARVLSIGRIPLLKVLGNLEKSRRLVRAVGRRYAFDDHQIQEAVYEGLEEIQRRESHLRIASAIREQVGDGDPADVDGGSALSLCGHCLRGGDPEMARPWVDPALRHLAATYQSGAAVELIDQALTVEGLLDGAARVGALLEKAAHLDFLGWPSDEKETLETAVETADVLGDASLRARARRCLGAWHRHASAIESAREHLEEAAAIAREAADSFEEAAATAELGLVCLQLDEYPEARALCDRAGEICDDPATAGLYAGRGGLVDLALGRYDEAERRLSEVLDLARDSGDERTVADHAILLAEVLLARGRYSEARDRLEEALAISRRIGDRRGEGRGYLGLGLLLPLLGRSVPGRQLLEEARAAFQQVGSREGRAAATHGLAMLAEEDGRDDEAELLYEESLSLRRRIGDRSGIADTLIRLGRLRGRTDRRKKASGDLVEALDLSRELDRRESLVLAAAQMARFARGDPGYAAEMLARHGDRMGLHARMEAHLALLRVTGDEEHRERARALLDRVLEQSPEDCRERMRERVKMYGEIISAE